MTTAADDCAQASQGFLAQDLAGTASQSELAMASAAHMRVVRFPRDYVFTDYIDLQSAWMNHVSG